MRARVWIRQGDLSQAADWAGERGVSATDEVSYLREFDHLTLVRLLIAQHRADPGCGAADQAVALLARLLEAAEATGRAGSLLEIRMLHALARDAQGRRAGAREALATAFARAPEPEGRVRLFLDEGAPMIGLLSDARDHGTAADHVQRLLRVVASGQGEAATAGKPPTPTSTVSLSDREMQVLRLLDSELSGPQIARELFVSHNTLRTHTKHIFTKLEVTNRRAAVGRARERGLM
jgi:LuxR family maltose regulon positive regulatory protein